MNKMFVRFFFSKHLCTFFSLTLYLSGTHAPIKYCIFAVYFMDVHALPIQWLKCDKMGRWETWPLILFQQRAPNGAAVENRIKDERLWYGRPRSVNGVTFQPATKKRNPWQLAGVRTSLCSAEIRNISLNWPFCVGQVSEWHLWFIKFNPLCLCWCWKKETSVLSWAMWKPDYQNIYYVTCILTVKCRDL